MPWRVQRRCRSDQPIALTSPPSSPRACTYHRSSYRLLLRRPFGPKRRRLCSSLPASDAPSKVCTLLVASRRCIDSRPAATPAPRAETSPHAVYFAVPVHRRSRLLPRRPIGAGRHRQR
jgi:hypothetical protein